jgi:hypothetical protein
MLILELHFDYITTKIQNQLEFNVLKYMKRMHTCDTISLIQCIFLYLVRKYDTEEDYYPVDCNRAVPVVIWQPTIHGVLLMEKYCFLLYMYWNLL